MTWKKSFDDKNKKKEKEEGFFPTLLIVTTVICPSSTLQKSKHTKTSVTNENNPILNNVNAS